jgi:putative protein-disulfide isomerase
MRISILIILALLLNSRYQAQTNKKMEEKNKKNSNPLLCDPEKGFCEIPSSSSNNQQKPIKLIYFTDPICSSCWGIEPQLRKLKLEYGNDIEIEYRMGGLLPDWSYNSGGISKPSDVANHWDEVSVHYDMPIDGDIWIEDPLHSSYPPSIAFKAAQMEDESKAIAFLRRIREMVFLEKKNITKWEYLKAAAIEVGLDTLKLKTNYETQAIQLFQKDLEIAKNIGVRGFPTLFFIDSSNNQQMLYGYKGYGSFEEAVLKSHPKATKINYDATWSNLFKKYPTLTTKEFSELSNITKANSEILLQKLVDEGLLNKLSYKNGVLWLIKITSH